MHMSSKFFCLPCTWIFLLQNYFLNYGYLKDIYKPLKETEKNSICIRVNKFAKSVNS